MYCSPPTNRKPDISFKPNLQCGTARLCFRYASNQSSLQQAGSTQRAFPEEQHVARIRHAILEALRYRAMRRSRSGIFMLALHAASYTRRPRMGTCCGSWRADRIHSGLGTIRLGLPEKSACSCSWRTGPDRGVVSCLVHTQGLTVHSSRHCFPAQIDSEVGGHEKVSPIMGRAHSQLAIRPNGLLGSCPKRQRALVRCNGVRTSRSRGGRQTWLPRSMRGVLRHDLQVYFARAVGRLHQNALNQTAALLPSPRRIAWRCWAKRTLAQPAACKRQIAQRAATSHRRSERCRTRAGT